MHMKSRKARLQPSTRRNRSPSLPCRFTAEAAIARFWGEIILPSTPPEELAAAIRVWDRFACWAAVICSTPKRELEEVSEPVTATPSQPRIGDRKAKKLPAPATHRPRV